MNTKDSFLNIEEINEANKEKLLLMRKTLYAAVVRNSQKEEKKGMYLISLAIFSEFERLTADILGSDVVKS